MTLLQKSARWLRGTDGLAVVTWLLFFIVVPMSSDVARTTSILVRLTSIPGLLELLLTFIAAALVLEITRQDPAKMLGVIKRPAILPLILFYGIGLLSALLSDYRLNALAFSGQGLVGLLLTVVVFGGLLETPKRWGLRLLYVAAAAACAIAAARLLVSPAMALTIYPEGDLRLGGVGLHPNQLGFLAALLGLGGLSYWSTATGTKAKVWSVLMVALAIPVLVGTRGRVDFVGFIAGVVIILLASGWWKIVAVAMAVLAAAIAFVPTLSLQAMSYLSRGLSLPQFIGRYRLWEYIVERTLSSGELALLGEGISTSPMVLRGVLKQWPYPGHAHNLLIEALNSLGFPGVVLILASLIMLGYGVIKVVRRPPGNWGGSPAELLAVYVLLVAISIVENSVGGRPNVYAFAYWALAAATAYRLTTRAPNNITGGRVSDPGS